MQLPQDRQRSASKLACSSSRPPTTSSNALTRASGSSSGWLRRVKSPKYHRCRSSRPTTGCLAGRLSDVEFSQASMVRAARLPWPTPMVTVRSDGTASPPAKMPGTSVIRLFGSTWTTSPSKRIPGIDLRKSLSVSWPRARITVSAASFSNRPVPRGLPFSSSSMISTVRSSSTSVMVRSQFIFTPSRSASAASSAWAGICSAVRR
jgi:hypothetical protein